MSLEQYGSYFYLYILLTLLIPAVSSMYSRSEERRVGKEC